MGLKNKKNNVQPKHDPPRRNPRGFFILSDDLALEEASREVAADFEDSIKKTASLVLGDTSTDD